MEWNFIWFKNIFKKVKLWEISCCYSLLLYIKIIGLSQDLRFKAWNGTAYDAVQIFPANGVADDFGTRRILPHNYHWGIDYNSVQDDNNNDKWNLILAPKDGTILDVNFSVKFLRYLILLLILLLINYIILCTGKSV